MDKKNVITQIIKVHVTLFLIIFESHSNVFFHLIARYRVCFSCIQEAGNRIHSKKIEASLNGDYYGVYLESKYM